MGFFDELRRAVDRTAEFRQRLFPIPKTNAQLAIRHVRNTWWLVHESWMPLNFDSFEEAVQFAERYIVKRRIAA